MRLIETPLAGAFVIEFDLHRDARGYFARTFDAKAFAELGLDGRVVQCSTSFNARAGTLRGMHYQASPHGEAKLVRCTCGAMYDVIVDLRPDSRTYCKWVGVELAAHEPRQLFVPVGLAHGFETQQPDTEVHYQLSQPYVSEAARGVRWDDPAFAIEWPAEPRVISQRDREYADFSP